MGRTLMRGKDVASNSLIHIPKLGRSVVRLALRDRVEVVRCRRAVEPVQRYTPADLLLVDVRRDTFALVS